MNALLAIPMEIRLPIVFVLGTCLGSVVNLAAYRLAYRPRRIGPWFRRDAKAPPRRPADWLPVVGWLGLRREAAIHGPGFWIRPLLVELLLGAGLALLYWWEGGCLGLLPPMAGRAPRCSEIGLFSSCRSEKPRRPRSRFPFPSRPRPRRWEEGHE